MYLYLGFMTLPSIQLLKPETRTPLGSSFFLSLLISNQSPNAKDSIFEIAPAFTLIFIALAHDLIITLLD